MMNLFSRCLFVSLVVVLSFSGSLKAQFTQPSCIDSNMVSFNPCFGTTYQPVCGCDNVTYRNECLAIAAGIVNFGYVDGPCEFMDFDFNPNPVYTAGQLDIKVICKDVTDINVWIFDAFFRQRYYQVSRQFKDVNLFPDVRNFGNGLYFIVIEAEGVVKVKRLLINQIID
jgi:hypothetical protein